MWKTFPRNESSNRCLKLFHQSADTLRDNIQKQFSTDISQLDGRDNMVLAIRRYRSQNEVELNEAQ